MICRMCGAEIPDWFVICGICGTPVKPLFGGRKKSPSGSLRKLLPLSRVGKRGQEADVHPEDLSCPAPRGRIASSLSSLSLKAGIAAILALGFPAAALPLSAMAFLFGLASLLRGESGRKQAAAGISIGTAVFLTGAVLMFSASALRPYQDDFRRILEERLQHFR